ncbi:BatA domain-containing protein [Christiangramia salexigens]|uniref:Aerotolerance regulator N-terminal domain-containing protein n=1 Tax=Christiangramia salexigens TaxID=1913577 RepID=A0A1L3J3G6_9FLAO|nr:BatA domain-containing protein [Christiangramia salexigens]APG59669.1 hypothetical protein LPB144_04245 [Christiangramia salexigens]
MYFQHPELLYALFLLIIPLIIHLFRLRKFQKEEFTNVKFLKKVIQETRKSSKLKKLLILITRLLLLSCLILAFAQPFIPASEKALIETMRLVYLDNSFSMQATSGETNIFRKSINQLLENLEPGNSYGFITNDEEFFNYSVPELKKELQNLDLTSEVLEFKNLQLKAKNYFKKHPGAKHELILVSDFQKNLNIPDEILEDEMDLYFINPGDNDLTNISIDTAYISKSDPQNIQLDLRISANQPWKNPVTVSVYNNEKLLGRKMTEPIGKSSAELRFLLQNGKIDKGKIQIEDSGLPYDNRLYFSINPKQAVKVVVVSPNNETFLDRIYTNPEFSISNYGPSQIDYNQLSEANLIVLNELENIPGSLINNISTRKQNGASLIIIPATNAEDYGTLLNTIGFTNFTGKSDSEKLITEIKFEHPLMAGVFEKRTGNFDYPKVKTSFVQMRGNPILQFQDKSGFLLQLDNTYLFTAPLNSENSNFINSPLIVPVFYQIGLRSLKNNQLYYQTNVENVIDLPLQVGADQVVHMMNNDLNLIPRQQNFDSYVQINTSQMDIEAGNYIVKQEKSSEEVSLSFNYDRKESDLTFLQTNTLKNVQVYSSVSDFFSKTNATLEITLLWKWFVIFAMVFLAIEMLLIKFFK